jgi:hypothetical protein
MFLERLEREGFAHSFGLSEMELRGLVNQVSEHLDECLAPGMEFSLTVDPDSPWFGQYEFVVLGVRRDRKGFETLKAAGDEIDSFVVDLREKKT